MTKVSRLLRRLILKNFGSYKKFAIAICVACVTLYFVKSTFLSPNVIKDEQLNEIQNDTLTQTTQESSGVCGVNDLCPQGRIQYFIKSGYQTSLPPVICFNGKNYVGNDEVYGRGVNLVVINELTMMVEDVRIFDTYTNGDDFHTYLMHNISDYRIILFATYDDGAKALLKESRKLLNHFGSTKINVLQFRDALVFVGQKGLTQGSAIEKYVRRFLNREYAELAELSGCLSPAVGRLSHFAIEEADPELASGANCGIRRDCGASDFPVHLYSGFQNTDLPKICINGKNIMVKDIGRGINVAIVDPKTKEIVKSGRFDTYEYGNTSLEKVLESVKEGEIVIAVTHDEATMRLTSEIKKQFQLLGSFYVNKLAMRDAWGFVGQRGLQGRSPYEELEFAPNGGMTWSEPVDRRFCIPAVLTGFTLMPSDVRRNQKRIEFCNKYIGYGEFCSGGRNDEFVTPAVLQDEELKDHAVFSFPILVVPGANKNAFRIQLESLIANPGIKPEMVSVYFSSEFEEYRQLIDIFGFKSFPVRTSDVRTNYTDLLATAIEKIWFEHSSSKYVMVFEEEVMPKKHYLSFIAQCFSSVDTDETLVGISGWNENGYLGVSTIPNVVYRTETFPGLGFLLKKSFYDSHMKDKLASCCVSRSWDGWLKDEMKGFEMLVPDTSFVMRRPFEDTTLPEHLLQLFNRPRAYQKKDPVLIRNKDQLAADKYEQALVRLLKSSTAIKISNITGCHSNLIPKDVTGKSFSIFYEQSDWNGDALLSLLCHCFKISCLRNHKPRGMHHGLIRFSIHENHVFLVGSTTKYYVYKPNDKQPLEVHKHPPAQMQFTQS